MLRLVPLLLLAAACSSSSSTGGGRSGAAHDGTVARGLAFSHTYEVRFDDEAVAGYMVEFFKVPLGIIDERGFPAGTVLVQDLDFETLGFITPGSQAYAHDADQQTLDLGFGGRDHHVSRILGRTGRPRYRSIQPGVPGP